MDIRASAEDFIAFLLDCVSKFQSTKEDAFIYNVKKGGGSVQAVSATVLPALAHFPLSEFTGPLHSPTIVFTSQERLKDREEDSPELKPILHQFSDSVLEDFPERKEGGAIGPVSLVQIVKKETVFVGQKLSFKRRYLNQETDFHPGSGHDTIIHADLSHVKLLSLDLARTLVSLYLVGSQTQPEASLPAVWVPCVPNTDCGAKEDIVGLACMQNEAQVSAYCVRDKTLSGGEAGMKKDTRGTLRPADLRGSALARYDILSSPGGHVSGPQLAVECVWKDPEALRAMPPNIGTEAVLHVAVEPGHLESLFTMFSEIQTLVSICEAASTGEGRYASSEDEGVLKNRESLAYKIGDFFGKINIPLSHTLQVGVVSPSIENTVYKPRENLDFTESLWLFIKDAGSIEDLQATLSAVFKSLLLGKVRNIILRESNNLSLAALLRQLIKCKSVSERQLLAPQFQVILAATKISQTLAEIGLDKMKRDLKGFLIGTKMATESDVDSFLIQRDKGLLAQAQDICKLYHVVELVATVLACHFLPTLCLVNLARTAMDYYKQRQVTGFETTPLFIVSLPRNSTVLRPTVDMCRTIPPRTWTLFSKSTGRIKVMTTLDSARGGVTHTSEPSFVYEATCHNV